MSSPVLPDDLWKRLEPLIPKPKERRHVQFAGRKPTEPRRVLTGILFVLRTGIPWRWLPATSDFPCGQPAGAIFSNGRKRAFGKTSLKACLRNSRQPTRSIGIAPLWIVPRCAHPAEAQKPAQIPRIGANWEASIMCSPMPTASPWPLF